MSASKVVTALPAPHHMRPATPIWTESYHGCTQLHGHPLFPVYLWDMFVHAEKLSNSFGLLPHPEAALDEAFPPEFGTNLRKQGDEISLVTTKFLGWEHNWPRGPAVLTERLSEAGPHSSSLIDFLYNALRLELIDTPAISRFASSSGDGYLLSEENVETLITQGIHEAFEASVIDDAVNMANKVDTFARNMYGISDVKKKQRV